MKRKIEIRSHSDPRIFTVQRKVSHLKGSEPGPLIIIICGIHGNEPTGFYAMHDLMQSIDTENFMGEIVVLSGNMAALESGVRFIDRDLNRIWNIPIQESTIQDQEHIEKLELKKVVDELISSANDEVIILDLHTTSSHTTPFLTLNSDKKTLDFCRGMPYRAICNINDYVHGAFFTSMNEHGIVAMGFEAGQHDSKSSIVAHKLFVNEVLHRAGMYTKASASKPSENASFYKIIDRFEIQPHREFAMRAGFHNFEKINQGDYLATYDNKKIYAPMDGNIFLPLYQKQGNDGFFIVSLI